MLTDTRTLCVENVKRFIHEHLGEPLDRETLAAAEPGGEPASLAPGFPNLGIAAGSSDRS